MNVTLLAHTPNPERLVATAARLCYSADDVETIMDEMCDHEAEKQIKLLQSIGHESPIEHVSFTFAIEGVSRSLLAQITRHRLASFSVRSQRYVSMSGIKHVTPDAIENDKLIDSLYDAFMKTSNDIYNQISDMLQLKYIENGMDAKSAEKKAIEDARFVLPNAACTSMVMTMNTDSFTVLSADGSLTSRSRQSRIARTAERRWKTTGWANLFSRRNTLNSFSASSMSGGSA